MFTLITQAAKLFFSFQLKKGNTCGKELNKANYMIIFKGGGFSNHINLNQIRYISMVSAF